MKYLLIAISIFSLSLMDISASEYEGLVVKVTDGDSVKIKVGEITILLDCYTLMLQK